MTCILKLAESGGGEVYLVNPDQTTAAISDRRLSRNPRERAAAEAELIIQNAREEAEKICLEALERGYNEGSEQGAAQYAQLKHDLEHHIKSVEEQREAFFAQIEPKVVKLSAEIAEKILRQELATRPEAVLDIVRNALKQMRDEESLKLYVNPEDGEMVTANKESLQESTDGVRQIEVVSDRRVDRGGCIAEASAGKLDARIKSQISEVSKILTEAASDNARRANPGPDQLQQDT